MDKTAESAKVPMTTRAWIDLRHSRTSLLSGLSAIDPARTSACSTERAGRRPVDTATTSWSSGWVGRDAASLAIA
jgi:hypothetical protein